MYPTPSPYSSALGGSPPGNGNNHNSSNNGIVHLNVGGTRFSTSRQTLLLMQSSSSSSSLGQSSSAGGMSAAHQENTFFTALLSGRISSHKDESGAYFIDRDPDLFRMILNYLRTRAISLENVDLKALLHEAEFYGIAPLVKQLTLCSELDQSGCGDVLFYTYLPPPLIPSHENKKPTVTRSRLSHPARNSVQESSSQSLRGGGDRSQRGPGAPPPPPVPSTAPPPIRGSSTCHSRNSSTDLTKSTRTTDAMQVISEVIINYHLQVKFTTKIAGKIVQNIKLDSF